ncbi:MAG: acyltransferase [Ignavibacteriales bacterium]
MKNIFIHPTAVVSEKCTIGESTKVWVNSQIRENAVIGENCIISKDTYIDYGVRIGNNVKIQNGVSIYHGVTIEDNVFVGPNAVFTNDFYPRAFNDNWEVRNTLIKEGASIGANATIVCGNILGKYCMVGSGSVVTKDVPEHALVVGNPARIIGYVCRCGYKLDKNGKCIKCGEIIKTEQEA